MKFTWEPRDVVAGTVVGKQGRQERWIIGYNPHEPLGENYAIISLEDGMITKHHLTAASAADHLNNSGDYPVCLFDFVKHGNDRAKDEGNG